MGVFNSMIRERISICPLSIAHVAGLGALQLSFVLLFVDMRLSVIPLAIFLVLCAAAPFLAGFAFFLPVISHGKRDMKKVSLTFDDGPDVSVTPLLLDLLARHGVIAAFFVTGEKALSNPELVRNILSRGHSICNHSYSHDPLLMLRKTQRLSREIENTQEELKKSGIVPLVFRPPAGITNPRLWRQLLRLGMYCVNFSCRGFDCGNLRVNGLSGRILKKVRGGDIVLLHDVKPKRSAVQDWLAEIDHLISGIRDKGLEPVSLPELIGRPVMINGGALYSPDPVRTFYDALAENYDDEQMFSGVSFARRKEYKTVMSGISKILSSGDSVLEVGAGTGIFTIPISKRCKKILAVDISENMLGILKQKAGAEGISNIDVRAGDINIIDFDMKFNLICAFSSFEYISGLGGLIKRLSAYLEPGGVLYFTTAHRSFFRFFTELGNAMRQGIWLHARSKREICNMLESADFHKIEISTHLLKSMISGGMLMEVCAVKRGN